MCAVICIFDFMNFMNVMSFIIKFKKFELHNYAVKYRALFKLAMHRGLHCCCPAYPTDIVAFHDSATVVHRLRLSTTSAAIVKPTKTQFGRRAFSVAGPDIWNSLPPEIRLTENFPTFRKQLKTHLFDTAFS